MIGFVSPELRPLLRIAVRGTNGAWQDVEFWLDTGFDGELLLPPEIVQRLGLSSHSLVRVILADGSELETNLLRTPIIWNGVEREVEIVVADGQPLLGLRLMHEHEIRIMLMDGGAVTIEPLH